MRILAIIPARGGSKGVPRKNIKMLAGKPLIAWTIESALEAKQYLDDIIVSTDDEEIASVAREYGADVPFLRPAELSDDKAPTLPAMQHAVKFMEQKRGVKYDWILLLQCTSPFRKAEDYPELIQMAKEGDCDSIVSVVQVFTSHPMAIRKIENGYLAHFMPGEKEGTRRQDYKPDAYKRNGVYYMTKRDVLMEDNTIYGERIKPYIMPEMRSVGIDSELDFKIVEVLMQENLLSAEK